MIAVKFQFHGCCDTEELFFEDGFEYENWFEDMKDKISFSVVYEYSPPVVY